MVWKGEKVKKWKSEKKFVLFPNHSQFPSKVLLVYKTSSNNTCGSEGVNPLSKNGFAIFSCTVAVGSKGVNGARNRVGCFSHSVGCCKLYVGYYGRRVRWYRLCMDFLQHQCGLSRTSCGMLQSQWGMLQSPCDFQPLCRLFQVPYVMLYPLFMIYKRHVGCCKCSVGFCILYAWFFRLYEDCHSIHVGTFRRRMVFCSLYA